MTTPTTATTDERQVVLQSIREQVDLYLDAHPELVAQYVELAPAGPGGAAAPDAEATAPPMSDAEAEAVARRVIEQAVAAVLAAQPGLVDELSAEEMEAAVSVAVDRAFAPFEN